MSCTLLQWQQKQAQVRAVEADREKATKRQLVTALRKEAEKTAATKKAAFAKAVARIAKIKEKLQQDSKGDAAAANKAQLLKLGQLTKATTVWRGMGGGKLPEQFTKGCDFSDIFAKGQGLSALGGIEFGFMSTSCCSVVTMPATAVQWHCATILPLLF